MLKGRHCPLVIPRYIHADFLMRQRKQLFPWERRASRAQVVPRMVFAIRLVRLLTPPLKHHPYFLLPPFTYPHSSCPDVPSLSLTRSDAAPLLVAKLCSVVLSSCCPPRGFSRNPGLERRAAKHSPRAVGWQSSCDCCLVTAWLSPCLEGRQQPERAGNEEGCDAALGFGHPMLPSCEQGSSPQSMSLWHCSNPAFSCLMFLVGHVGDKIWSGG